MTGVQTCALPIYNVNGTYGGPIKRDRLWFFAQGRDQGKRAVPIGGDFFYNLNAGVMGANYAPDRPKGNIFYKNTWRNVSGRFTLQASSRNKLNVFWDEQDTCQDPCDGVVSVYTSPESWWSVATRPNRLRQVSWTQPRTNRLLFEAGVSVTEQVYDLTHQSSLVLTFYAGLALVLRELFGRHRWEAFALLVFLRLL